MPLTTTGAQFIAKAVTGLNSPSLFSPSNFYLGVGDSSTAFNVAQTDLVAATNKIRKLATTVSESAGVITAVASYGTSEANFEWFEWASFNSASGGTMYNRKVESPSLGTKTSSQVWTLTVSLTHSAV